MKAAAVIMATLAVVLTCVFASASLAASTSQIIADASDGTVDGHYTIAEVRAALTAVRTDPTLSAYSDVESVLQNYLTSLLAASSPTPSPQPASTATTAGASGTTGATSNTGSTTQASGGQQLARTGGSPLRVFALGGTLLVTAVVLRRRLA